ncbi:MAG: hypothetical protein IVW57_08365 [Ktedonobacterales bacterium]|nr:hypothetical protein [Ktedonobacterales bacterium]
MGYLKRHMLASFIQWIPLATLVIFAAAMTYGTVQSNYRSAANDPQIQMAVDARIALMSGTAPQNLVPANKLDIAQSLAPYLAIYDTTGQVVASSATLHGQPLTLPSGVFESAKSMDMDVITWAPETNVRNAIVVLHYADGYVMAGRSLKLVEQRESNLDLEVGVASLAALVATYLAVLFTRMLASRLQPAGVRQP